MKQPNPYASLGLDRMSDRRRDEAWLNQLLAAENTVILATWRSKNLVLAGDEPRAAVLSSQQGQPLVDAASELVFLGIKQDVAHFAVDLSHHDEPHAVVPLPNSGEFVDLRSVSVLMPLDEAGMLAYAKGVMHWHARHRYCGVCGGQTEARDGGFLRVCAGDGCSTHHFPRTDPAVIMLVTKGDRAVLGRKAEWAEGMYSTLAGFVEPGESLEDAVAREVMEEVNIPVSNVRYHSSQPWPFPASLMLGFHADAESDDITPNLDELEDARWFTRAELADGAAGIARRPRSDSIARRLIDEWIREG